MFKVNDAFMHMSYQCEKCKRTSKSHDFISQNYVCRECVDEIIKEIIEDNKELRIKTVYDKPIDNYNNLADGKTITYNRRGNKNEKYKI